MGDGHFVHVGHLFRAFSGVEVADNAVRRQAGIPERRHPTEKYRIGAAMDEWPSCLIDFPSLRGQNVEFRHV
jgi:hypothetical protein